MRKVIKPNTDVRALCIAAGLIFTLAICAVGRADDAIDKAYPIKLSLPEKVGAKTTIAVLGSRQTNNIITVGNDVPIHQDQELVVELKGVSETLAIDAKGNETKLACTIGSFAKMDGTEILPAGSVVIADATPIPTREGDKKSTTHFSLKDGMLTPEQSSALDLVLSAHRPDSPTDSEMFGSNKPQKVGGTWPIHQDLVAASMPVTMKPEDITGECTLKRVERVGSTDCLRIEGTLDCKNFESPMPAGWKITDEKLDSHFSLIVPADGAATKVGGEMDLHLTFSATGAKPDGTPIKLESSIKQHTEAKSSPVSAEKQK